MRWSRQDGRVAVHQRYGDFQSRAEQLLERADVRIGGGRPWDIQVHHPGFFRRVFLQGSLGLGESYMDGWWDCGRLDEFFHRILKAKLDRAINDWHDMALRMRTRLFNLQTRTGAFRVGKHHYDLGDDLFECMLDERMIYSCAYWRDADNLDAAQEAKLDLVARKLQLETGMRVLDIGCGWGGAAAYMAEKYGVEVVGVTVSRRQADYAQRRWQGLPVDVIVRDYRDIGGDILGEFDHAYSIGMFEHVGYRNYRRYMEVVRRCLKPDGRFLLHTIGRNNSATHTNPWVARYIFPNSMLPSIRQIGDAIEDRFVMEDWHNFGTDYDRTLLAWNNRFEAACNRLAARYDNRFQRMWRFYLLMSAGGFRARALQLWQVLLSPEGIPGGCRVPR